MRVELIAEIASNHGGDIALAKEFIWRYAEAGADWIKFQTTRVKHLRPDDPQYAWFTQAELSDAAHVELKAECERAGVKFLTTVYNVAEVPFLASLGLEAIKVGSGEAGESGLAAALEGQFSRVLVSRGIIGEQWLSSPFHRFQEPEVIEGKRRWTRRLNATFFHCHTRYPCPPLFAQHLYMEPTSGWSDHCVGLDGARSAIMFGASIIEKHVSLPHQARPVKPWEATVEEFKSLRAFADEDPMRFLGRWQHA